MKELTKTERKVLLAMRDGKRLYSMPYSRKYGIGSWRGAKFIVDFEILERTLRGLRDRGFITVGCPAGESQNRHIMTDEGAKELNMGRWLEEYGCGCTFVTVKRSELIGYCGKHGDNRRHVYKLPEPVDCGLAK